MGEYTFWSQDWKGYDNPGSELFFSFRYKFKEENNNRTTTPNKQTNKQTNHQANSPAIRERFHDPWIPGKLQDRDQRERKLKDKSSVTRGYLVTHFTIGSDFRRYLSAKRI